MLYTLILIRKNFTNLLFSTLGWGETSSLPENQDTKKDIIVDFAKNIMKDGKITPDELLAIEQFEEELAIGKGDAMKVSVELRMALNNEMKAYSQRKIAEKQEKIATTEVNKKMKKYNKDYLTKAENLVTHASGNSDFKNKWLEIAIEDWKVQLYWASGEKLKYFTIPTMNEDGTVNNDINLARLNSIDFWFKDFVQAHVPEVKTFAEISEEFATNKENKERVADVNKEMKEVNKYFLNKAENLVTYASGNSDFKNKWLEIAIEDWKVQLYWASGEKLKYFTIPTMNEDGTVNNDINLARLNSIDFWFKDFVQAHVPEVKTFAEISEEFATNKENKERVADVNKEVKKFNKNGINHIWINIKALWNLPDGVSVKYNPDSSNVEVKYNNKIISSFQPMMKDSSWNLVNTDKKDMYIPSKFSKWVKDNTEKFA